ncbi:MAG: acylphosphatase [Mameliella sp.]|nr:acylphosphatase [Phaeodactylibacter sp.]NRA52405.1 acylphosphatase [Phaeodactylibacter sp.]
MQQVKLRIKGKVQGVYFRASTRDKAVQLGIKGWVKNEADGSVTAVGQGSVEVLEQWINWCHSGPEFAKVETVEQEKLPLSDFQQFNILR